MPRHSSHLEPFGPELVRRVRHHREIAQGHPLRVRGETALVEPGGVGYASGAFEEEHWLGAHHSRSVEAGGSFGGKPRSTNCRLIAVTLHDDVRRFLFKIRIDAPVSHVVHSFN